MTTFVSLLSLIAHMASVFIRAIRVQQNSSAWQTAIG